MAYLAQKNAFTFLVSLDEKIFRNNPLISSHRRTFHERNFFSPSTSHPNEGKEMDDKFL